MGGVGEGFSVGFVGRIRKGLKNLGQDALFLFLNSRPSAVAHNTWCGRTMEFYLFYFFIIFF